MAASLGWLDLGQMIDKFLHQILSRSIALLFAIQLTRKEDCFERRMELQALVKELFDGADETALVILWQDN